MPFSQDEVIKRTARRLGTNETRVRNFLDTYADEYIRHARETEPDLIAPTLPDEPPAEPAKSPRKRAKPSAKEVPAPADEDEAEAQAAANPT